MEIPLLLNEALILFVISVCLCLLTDTSMVEEIVEVDKFEDEDKLMKDYEHFMKLMEEWTSLSNLTRFHDSAIAQEDERVYMYIMYNRQTDRQTHTQTYVLL